MSRIYRYILADDHGIAPCPVDGLISLATCKPTIRRMATAGDWVLGFRPGSLERGLLLWGGRVGEVMSHGDYERRHRGRPDAVYRERPDGGYDRLNPRYHPAEKDMVRDLSGPVLLFDPAASVYLHGQSIPLPPGVAHLAAAGRGHRVNGTREDDVKQLEAWISELTQSVEEKGQRKGRVSGKGACAPMPRACSS